jgi:pimeloyl-ACP methyl ester carboxylesterase
VSLVVGFVLPIVLALGPAAGGGESRMTGAALLGWAIGWVVLALLSMRFTDRARRWALVPACLFGLTGIALIGLAPGSEVLTLLAWVWPVPVLLLSTWLILHVRRDVPGSPRWLLYPVVGVLALLAIGGATEAVIEATDGGPAGVDGQMVDVGGHELFVSCAGKGSPTVVLEGGMGQGSANFARIVPEVVSTTRVCAYDRAGRGRSEPASGVQDGPALARDLHALLAASGNPGPYVLAGHSSGGVYVRFFAAAFPDEVAGMVLLDAQTPHAGPPLARGESAPSGTLWGILPGLGRVGVARLVASVGADGAASFGDEYAQLAGILDAASGLPDLGNRPLMVVTAEAEALDGWLPDQDRLATLSTNASHRSFADLTHSSLIESESGAKAASDAIVAAVMSVRSGTRLDGSTESER